MRDNVFLENKKELELADFMNYADGSRGNLGKDIPVTIYRLDEPYQKLGRGLQVLERTVEEMLEYSKDLSVRNWKKYRKV